MSALLWLQSYKPSLSSGVYGGDFYNEPIEFYPQRLAHYCQDKNSEYYVHNKFHQTLNHIHFNIDVWYQFLANFTFDTKFISITPSCAQSLIKFYRYRYCNSKLDTLHMSDVRNLRELKQALHEHISACIAQWYEQDDNDKGVFIRFSNRSPKDGHKLYLRTSDEQEHEHKNQQASTPNDGDQKQNDEEENDEEKTSEKDPNAANAMFIDFCKKSAKDLFVDNADDAMSLIMSSERVFADLLCVLEGHKYPYKYLFYDRFTVQDVVQEEKNSDNDDDDDDGLEWDQRRWEICDVRIAIRKWEHRIRDNLEFRCFVYDKRLRAISQYNHYCYFKELGDDASFVHCIQQKIEQYFYDHIAQVVPYFEYVLDIGVVVLNELDRYTLNNLQCLVIELNPFDEKTGAALFDWRKDEQQLKHGKDVEMRVHKKAVLRQEFVDHYLNEFETYAIEAPWMKVLDDIEAQLQINSQEVSEKKRDCNIL
eukprot:CAMPEP_0202693562 /NCGR_PEP_ID=MMETSP1385-20130828/7640_1 /ASSEMBLY_ACC=CAM_ASM_000861 /TAXON_ID=933848 /ORGANISM="Elphidium margaritaceum" /LENGTH=478 /DNA_ID=CAMNT_0049349253 /DNA_START=13 /DNA_END=1449 /DNA_ORIENTATION=-